MRGIIFLLLLLPPTVFAADVAQPLGVIRVSSPFGNRTHPVKLRTQRHDGLDLAARKGSPIHSLGAGKVIFAGQYGGYGNLIVISHTTSLVTLYGHCDEVRVGVGDRVKVGELIGTVGATGMVTGPHLHLEVRLHGMPLDPAGIMPSR